MPFTTASLISSRWYCSLGKADYALHPVYQKVFFSNVAFETVPKNVHLTELTRQNNTDVGKCTHQCDETQGNDSTRVLSTKHFLDRQTTKEEGSKEEDRQEGADLTMALSRPFMDPFSSFHGPFLVLSWTLSRPFMEDRRAPSLCTLLSHRQST